MAFGNPKQERAQMELTYEDTADFARQGEEARGNLTVQAPGTPYATGVICAYSRTLEDRSRQTHAQQNLDYSATVFCAPELPVLPGDSITLRRFGRDDPDSAALIPLEVVGRPMLYATHQQVYVREVGIA